MLSLFLTIDYLVSSKFTWDPVRQGLSNQGRSFVHDILKKAYTVDVRKNVHACEEVF